MEGRSFIGAGLAMGAAVGAALGIAMDDLAIGIGAGVAVGAGSGFVIDAERIGRRFRWRRRGLGSLDIRQGSGRLVIPDAAKRRSGTLARTEVILPEAASAAIRETGQDTARR